MRIVFRTDGNATIGAGHVMRMLSVAIAARKANCECIFVTADESYSDIISKNNGFDICILDTDYSDMDKETDKLEIVLNEIEPDILIVDSYYVTYEYLSRLHKKYFLVYVDDMNSFSYPVDVLINYNIGSMDIDYYNEKTGEKPLLILDSEYVPLREEFQHNHIIDINENVSNIFFSAGGADPERIALRFVKEVINNDKLKIYDFHLVLGKFEPDIDEIKEISKMNENIHVYQNVGRMSDVILRCDLAISAAGSTLYELCACGVPTITYILADNQIYGAMTFEKREVMVNAGDDRKSENLLADICRYISILSEDFSKRIKMQRNALDCVDGQGASRIVSKLIGRK